MSETTEKSGSKSKPWGLYISLFVLTLSLIASAFYGYWRITSVNRLLAQQMTSSQSHADECQHTISALQEKLITAENNLAQIKNVGAPAQSPVAASTSVVEPGKFTYYPSFSSVCASLMHASSWIERRDIIADNLQHLVTVQKNPVWSIEAPVWFAVLTLFLLLFFIYGMNQIKRLLSTLFHRIKIALTTVVTQEQRISVYQNLLNAAENTASLKSQWNGVPWKLKREPQVLLCYVKKLQSYHADAEDIQSLLVHHLKKSWDADLMMCYGLLITRDSVKQLARAEGWINGYSEHAIFLLTLGRLSVRCQLWGKARQYFESSLKKGERSDTYWEYGKLLEQIGDPTLAMSCYREGLRCAQQFPA